MKMGHSVTFCRVWRFFISKGFLKWVPKNSKIPNVLVNAHGPIFVGGANLAFFILFLAGSLMANQHLWYLNRGCSKHMTREKRKFVKSTP